jgi:PKD repeat protein
MNSKLAVLLRNALALCLLVLLAVATQSRAGQLSLAWDASADARVVGYMLSYGSASGNYSSAIDVGNNVSYTVTGLSDGSTLYFAVRAYDAGRNLSAYSNQVSATISSGAPTPSFSATPSSGAAPLLVSFHSVSTGVITSYSWDYGDGASGNSNTSTHVYAVAGTYAARLTVTGPGGSNTSSATNITVFPATTGTTPAMISPSPNTVLAGSSVTFGWSANGAPVSEWWLYVGSTVGSRDYADTGPLGAELSRTVTGLPKDASAVFVRLWFKTAGSWQYTDVAYTAASGTPSISSPAPGSSLPGSSATFTWSANGADVSEWWLYAGSSVGDNNYANSGSLGTSLSETLAGLPTNGSTIFLRLWFKIADVWQFVDHWYMAFY